MTNREQNEMVEQALKVHQMVEEIISYYQKKFPGLDRQPTALLILLARAYDLVHNIQSKHANKLGISRAKWTILLLLYRTPERKLSMTDISNQMHVTRTNITKLVDGLEKDGFVKRVQDPNDRRSLLVTMTNKGQLFMDMHLPDYWKLSDWIMNGLTDDEKATLETLLYKLIGSLMVKSKSSD